jgi:hypothetical protein
MSADAESTKLARWRWWLIATGVPLAAGQIAFSLFLEGWMATVMAISGTLIGYRTMGLIVERQPVHNTDLCN